MQMFGGNQLLQSVLFHLDGLLIKSKESNQILFVNEEIFQFIPSLFQDFTNHKVQTYMITNQSKEFITSSFHISSIADYITTIGFIDDINPSEQLTDLLQEWGLNSINTIGLMPSNHMLTIMNDLNIPTLGYQNLLFPNDDLSNCKFLVEGFDSLDYSYIEYVYHYVHELPQIIARTNRLMIRELSLSDVPYLHSIANQIQIKDKIDDMRGTVEEEQEKMSAYINYIYRFYGIGLWGIFLSDTNQLIGRGGVEYKKFDDQTHYYELGFYISSEMHGKGYGQESIAAILDYCFHTLALPSIIAFVKIDNDNSRKLLQRIGMTFDCVTTRNQQPVYQYILHNPNHIN